MKSSTQKRRDGFEGEKLISLPDSVWKNALKSNYFLGQLFVKHIGYFPNAASHYRDRRTGCPDNILIYCLKGKGWFEIKDRRFDIGVNEFIMVPATKESMSYGANESDPWTIYWVHFSGRDMDAFNKSFGINIFDGPQSIVFNEKGLALWQNMYSTLEMGYSKENLCHTSLSLYHLISTFLYPAKHVSEKKQDEKDLISDTILYMRKEISNKLTVEDFAKNINLSSSYFTNLFRKACGMSPMEYFIHLKLQKACLLLYTSDIKIRDIASQLSYDDPYYFSRLFKKYMNVSPEQYRLARRKNN
jgi:AraC-like DNA-binding protein